MLQCHVININYRILFEKLSTPSNNQNTLFTLLEKMILIIRFIMQQFADLVLL